LSIQDLRIGDKILALAAQHQDKLYITKVILPAGCRLGIGHTLPANAAIESVTLNGKDAAYEVRSTHRGHEVVAQVADAGAYRLVIQTR
jgi:hypothetical protein